MKICQRASMIGLAVLLALCLFFTMIVRVDATQDRPLKIWAENENGMFRTLKVVDEDTGVNYIVVSHDYKHTIAICPRYNADGSLYVTP